MQNFLLICYAEKKTNPLKVVAKQAFPSSSLTFSDAKDKKQFQRENVFIVKA